MHRYGHAKYYVEPTENAFKSWFALQISFDHSHGGTLRIFHDFLQFLLNSNLTCGNIAAIGNAFRPLRKLLYSNSIHTAALQEAVDVLVWLLEDITNVSASVGYPLVHSKQAASLAGEKSISIVKRLGKGFVLTLGCTLVQKYRRPYGLRSYFCYSCTKQTGTEQAMRHNNKRSKPFITASHSYFV